MSVRMRHTHGHTRNRRSHHGLTEVRLSKCEKCGASHRRHRACEKCGTYRGKVVLNVMQDAEKKIKKAGKASNNTKKPSSEKTSEKSEKQEAVS